MVVAPSGCPDVNAQSLGFSLPNVATKSAMGSTLRSLASTFFTVNDPGSSFFVTSFQSSGVEIAAPGDRPREVGRRQIPEAHFGNSLPRRSVPWNCWTGGRLPNPSPI